MRVPLLLTLAVLAIVLWASEADGAPRDPRLAGVEDYAFALGLDVDSDPEVASLAPYDLVVVDGELTAPGESRSCGRAAPSCWATSASARSSPTAPGIGC